jgi:hypothetical protein
MYYNQTAAGRESLSLFVFLNIKVDNNFSISKIICTFANRLEKGNH